jgi:hypothetical protein
MDLTALSAALYFGATMGKTAAPLQHRRESLLFGFLRFEVSPKDESCS